MSNNTLETILTVSVLLSIFLLMGYGYVANIVAIAHSAFMWEPMFVLHCIGVFIVPLGIILGFL